MVPAGASRKVRLAAEEINERLRELGAKSLPVLEAGPAEERAFDGRRIGLAVAGDNARVPQHEQGYWVDTLHGGTATIEGRDEQGLLWAAVTFRRMLVRGGDGRVLLL